MLPLILLAVFAALLLLAAIEDVRRRRIPNALTAAMAVLFLPYAMVAPHEPALLDAAGLALATFLIGWLLFARGWIGGGDVKLITAATLWAGPELILPFLLVTSLAGGALALLALATSHWAPLVSFTLGNLGLLRLVPPVPADTLPYGLAIAIGGLFVAFELAS